MGFPDYKRDLQNDTVAIDFILDKYFHSGQSAVFAGANTEEEPLLKRTVLAELFRAFEVRLHPHELVICGSAHLGFSPVPGEKLGRPFDPGRSDIDIAVISQGLFDRWWRELQTTRMARDRREGVADDMFWGFINPALVRDLGTVGPSWWACFGGIRTDRANGVRGRLYRDFWSMQNYHRLAVRDGRDQVRGR